uniref:Uncharacterized protein n=2 Tax=Oryza sativa subsp. japonica TaxID=39947 RepID=Q10IK4_ORYSJ|nr:hypothetical protein [Oryza sativa Japonica Group]ABF96985.1 retrotransposon, putative, centromere-specific [Oryza sativa Japonica Group]
MGWPVRPTSARSDRHRLGLTEYGSVGSVSAILSSTIPISRRPEVQNIKQKEENNEHVKKEEKHEAPIIFEESLQGKFNGAEIIEGIRLICTGKINNLWRGVSIAKAQHNNV